MQFFVTFLLRRVQDLNLRAGISRFAGFRVRCITTLPTLQSTEPVYQKIVHLAKISQL